jgi:hypothetical protein
MEYEGAFEYLDEPGYLDVLSFIVRAGSISFNMDSCPPDIGRWNIHGVATETSPGSYAVNGIRTTQSGVSGPAANLTFEVPEFDEGDTLHVKGTWSDSDSFTHFAGTLERKEQ